MIDREKVIEGLECCFGSIGKACPMECPYRVECLMQYDEYNMYSVMHDALKLLKEQPQQQFFVDSDGKLTPLPVQKHGHWKDDKYGNMLCSVCGGLAIVSMTGCLVDRHLASYPSDYCPHCGAKMDEEVKQDAES